MILEFLRHRSAADVQMQRIGSQCLKACIAYAGEQTTRIV